MPTYLFCIDVLGRIFRLPTASSQWKPLPYMGVEFKRISASQNSLWAIGSDQQVYVYIYDMENPIRIKVETYENQRWNPIDGFCDKLLATDRYHFSSKDGKEERQFNSIDLPSLGWQWESAWQIDNTLDGTPLETEGWTYAVDFPAAYSAQKRFTSCVRRRRWVRYRRYVAVNAWSSVPPLHRDAVEEPFVDVAVGGAELPGWEANNLMVWAVTIRGRVMYRSNVSWLSPEGDGWRHVPTPAGSEASQVSCGPSGLTWATTWDGAALVRTGTSRDTPHGTDWCQVLPPAGVKLQQVSVGDGCVWAVSRDKRVFFRKGIKGYEMCGNPTLARGTGWLEMVGNMATVSVGPSDQVLTLGTDGVLYLRAHVTRAELTGRTWRALTVAPPGSAAASRSGSLASLPTSLATADRLVRPLTTADRLVLAAERSAPDTAGEFGLPQRRPPLVEPPAAGSGDAATIGGDGQPPASVGSHQDSDTSSGSGDTTSLRLLRLDDDDEPTPFVAGDGPESIGWSSIAAGGCCLDPLHPPPWFSDSATGDKPEELWRQTVLERLKERSARLQPFRVYDEAVERSSWVRSTKCRWWTDAAPHCWAPAVLELEQAGTTGAEVDSGQLSVYTSGARAASVCLSEISAVLNSSESRRLSALSVYTPERLRRRQPLKLWFAEEAELEDWIDMIQTACVRLRRIDGAPSAAALWAVTERGDVLVSDQRLSVAEQEITGETHAALSQCQLVSESAGCPLPLVRRLERGFTEGCSLVISYKLPAHASWFSVNLMTGKAMNGTNDSDVAFHFNPRINRSVIVRNSKLKDAWGKEETDGEQPFRSGDTGELHIVCQRGHYKVLASGLCTQYKHRTDCRRVSHLGIQGDVVITQVSYDAGPAAAAPEELFWRQLGGHLRRVETGPSGVVWGLGHDQTPWVYTGGTGGGSLSEHGGSEQLHTMTDTRYFYIYENQRWNPVSGFSYHGLATDRPTWSDRSGRVALTKDTVLPPSRHWNWVSSWSVDFHVSGGVDEEGWQYALDFPASYHGWRGLQDFVRRRRWYRKCQLSTTGPWEKVENVKLRDLSMHELGGEVHLWAVTSAGDVMHRVEARPDGSGGGGYWRSVSTDQPFSAVSCGGHGRVWAVARDGTARLRYGVSEEQPLGTGWGHVEHPEGHKLRHVSAGDTAVWAVDDSNRLYWRQEVLPIFPEGLTWRHVADHVSHVSCGVGDQTWVASERHDGALLRRLGVCAEDTCGSDWQTGLSGGWSHVTGRALKVPASAEPADTTRCQQY